CFFYDGPNVLFPIALALFRINEKLILAADEATSIVTKLKESVYDCDQLLEIASQEFDSLSSSVLDEKRFFQRSKVVKEVQHKNKKTLLRELSRTTRCTFTEFTIGDLLLVTREELESFYQKFIAVSSNNHF